MSLRARILLPVLPATPMPAAIVGIFEFNLRDARIDEAKRDLSSLATYAVDNRDEKMKGTVQRLSR